MPGVPNPAARLTAGVDAPEAAAARLVELLVAAAKQLREHAELDIVKLKDVGGCKSGVKN